MDGRIGDDPNEVEMDFANEHVGPGMTGTQEELILGVSPETCPIVLFNEILHDKDAVAIQGGEILNTVHFKVVHTVRRLILY